LQFVAVRVEQTGEFAIMGRQDAWPRYCVIQRFGAP
jgi:hypothetical protein